MIGGYVYRGQKVRELDGAYVFGVWCSEENKPTGKVFAGVESPGGQWSIREIAVRGKKEGNLGEYVLGFGQDESGEVYVLTTSENGPVGKTGTVYRIADVRK